VPDRTRDLPSFRPRGIGDRVQRRPTASAHAAWPDPDVSRRIAAGTGQQVDLRSWCRLVSPGAGSARLKTVPSRSWPPKP